MRLPSSGTKAILVCFSYKLPYEYIYLNLNLRENGFWNGILNPDEIVELF
jgi:hypothetical protein